MSQATKVIIQAGGKGSRLYPYTKVLPKPLMPVGGTPILEIVIRQLAAQGFRELVITLGYLGEMIRLCCGDGSKWGVHIEYVTEKKPLGTIGPVRLVPGLTRPFLVMNGDLLTDLDFAGLVRWHQSGTAPLSIATYMKPVNVSLGVLDTDDQGYVVGFREKPTLHFPCSMGVYVVNPELVDLIPADTNFGFDDLMYKMLKLKLPARSHTFSGTWMDIGRPEDFHAACELFEKNPEVFLPQEETQILRMAG
jgi:NDP-sugar pyrophosphorylase family protein